MEQSIKQRLVGAVVLLILAAIFLPHLLKGPSVYDEEFYDIRIPPQPDEQFEDFEPVAKDFSLSIPSSVATQVLAAPAADQAAEDVAVPAKPNEVPEQTVHVDTKPSLPKVELAPQGKEKVVEVVEPVDIAPLASATPGGAWVVQVASFKNKKNALRLREQLREQALTSFVEQINADQGVIYRVRVGPTLLKSDAQAIGIKVEQLTGLHPLVLAFP